MRNWSLGWLGQSKQNDANDRRDGAAAAGDGKIHREDLSGFADEEKKYSFLIDLENADDVKRHLVNQLVHTVGKDPLTADANDWFFALASLVRGLLSERYIHTMRDRRQQNTRRVYYLSLEWLVGSSLKKHLLDLDIMEITKQALQQLDQDFDEIAAIEHDPALGNGGLGRLAACFLESMVSQGYPGCGYGVRYDFGLFRQGIEDGRQVEHPDPWLKYGSPWEFERVMHTFPVKFFGHTECHRDAEGRKICKWVGTQDVLAMAYDFPMSGFRNGQVTNLRLWAARATDDFDFEEFNRGNYIEAVEEKHSSENLSKVLYPDDSTLRGQELRLKQEYFFVSASLQDILARHFEVNGKDSFATLPDKIVIQLNDTHPALGIAEMMRLLVDEMDVDWGTAWDITRKCFCFTNHTLLPEALEKWPIHVLQNVLPRLLDIIYDINAWFMKEVAKIEPHDPGRTYVMSLVDDAHRAIRMANLSIVGSYRVNGVAKLHSDLLQANVFPEFVRMYPGRFTNVTNGVTPRRWMLQANPQMAALITSRIGERWMYDLTDIEALKPFAEDAEFRKQFMQVKLANKQRLAALIRRELEFDVDPAAMLFDTQVKRMHEYKRQLLNLLHVITRYNRILAGNLPAVPRLFTFAGKAAPGYYMAKQVIRLINDVAKTINADPVASQYIKIAFLPNYSASLAEVIIPGSDLSEQISTAGMEASGTGNMKFAMNGALTIGTMDGANIEIHDAAGADNIFIFGLTTEGVAELRRSHYNPWHFYSANDQLKDVIDMIGNGVFCRNDIGRYSGISHSLLDGGDHYLLLADYASYIAAQDKVDELYQKPDDWARKAIINVASMGYFSSDRSIRDYAQNIWNIKPVVG